MGWFAIIGLILQYGPSLINAIGSLITAIRTKNASAGKDAVTQATDLAFQIVTSFQTRSDMNPDQKREQAWKDLIAGSQSLGVTLSESNARTLVELAVQHVKANG